MLEQNLHDVLVWNRKLILGTWAPGANKKTACNDPLLEKREGIKV